MNIVRNSYTEKSTIYHKVCWFNSCISVCEQLLSETLWDYTSCCQIRKIQAFLKLEHGILSLWLWFLLELNVKCYYIHLYFIGIRLWKTHCKIHRATKKETKLQWKMLFVKITVCHKMCIIQKNSTTNTYHVTKFSGGLFETSRKCTSMRCFDCCISQIKMSSGYACLWCVVVDYAQICCLSAPSQIWQEYLLYGWLMGYVFSWHKLPWSMFLCVCVCVFCYQ